MALAEDSDLKDLYLLRRRGDKIVKIKLIPHAFSHLICFHIAKMGGGSPFFAPRVLAGLMPTLFFPLVAVLLYF